VSGCRSVHNKFDVCWPEIEHGPLWRKAGSLWPELWHISALRYTFEFRLLPWRFYFMGYVKCRNIRVQTEIEI